MSIKVKTDQLAARMKRAWEPYGFAVDEMFVRPSEWGRGAYEIVWESGPYEWAIEFASEGTIGREEYGLAVTEKVDVPDGVFIEPGYSFTLVCAKDVVVTYDGG